MFIGSPWGLSGLSAQDLSGFRPKASLDLPVSAFVTRESDEDAPETIYLYGTTFEGGGIVFVGGVFVGGPSL